MTKKKVHKLVRKARKVKETQSNGNSSDRVDIHRDILKHAGFKPLSATVPPSTKEKISKLKGKIFIKREDDISPSEANVIIYAINFLYTNQEITPP